MLEKEMKDVLDPTVGQDVVGEMKREIHRMQLRHAELMRLQEKLMAVSGWVRLSIEVTAGAVCVGLYGLLPHPLMGASCTVDGAVKGVACGVHVPVPVAGMVNDGWVAGLNTAVAMCSPVCWCARCLSTHHLHLISGCGYLCSGPGEGAVQA